MKWIYFTNFVLAVLNLILSFAIGDWKQGFAWLSAAVGWGFIVYSTHKITDFFTIEKHDD